MSIYNISAETIYEELDKMSIGLAVHLATLDHMKEKIDDSINFMDEQLGKLSEIVEFLRNYNGD
jgi:hypothetical protein